MSLSSNFLTHHKAVFVVYAIIVKSTILVFTVFLLSACAPATAQVRLVESTNACSPNGVKISGISVDSDFRGEFGYDVYKALQTELQDQGFQFHESYVYDLPKKAEIIITGTAEEVVNGYGNTGRVSQARVEIRSTIDDKTLFTFQQDRTVLIFNAPRLKDFAKNIVSEISKRFCQSR